MQPLFNFQGNAIIGVRVFLASIAGLGLAAVAILFLLATRRMSLARIVLGLALAGAGIYAGTLAAFSFTSKQQDLAFRQEKYFCEVDCHLAYSVLEVSTVKTLGKGPNLRAANGNFAVVTLRVRFDPNTISPHRGDAPLTPNPRELMVVDDAGMRVEPSAEGLGALESVEGPVIPLSKSLRPGESYTTKVVFDLPPLIQNPRLLILEPDWVTHFLIGHENSFFHKKTEFLLVPPRISGTA